ncbi:hypothetical protein HanIR_Chr16g0822331 [Helianthus annuus]|nr:hypothetical protein HanIR_Chr16g0822331 [Helianthus annuus]
MFQPSKTRNLGQELANAIIIIMINPLHCDLRSSNNPFINFPIPADPNYILITKTLGRQ